MKYIIIVTISIIAVLFIINIVDLNRYVIRSVSVFDKKVNKKVKICFISDLHNYYCTPKFYDDIREYRPDIILLGGDIITANPGKKQDKAYAFLEEVSTIAPTYLALGNHEYRAKIYPEVYNDMYPNLEKKLNELGIRILSNDSMDLSENGIRISASEIDRFYYKRFTVQNMSEDYIKSLIGECDKEKYNILLAHNPDYFDNYNKYGADLILSGHVHGGLIRLPVINGIAHPGVRFFPKFSGGAYNDKGKHISYADSYVSSKNDTIRMIVSCGIGFHTLPLRLFNPGELIFVTIDSK